MLANRYAEYGTERGLERRSIDFDRIRTENPLAEVAGAVTKLRRAGLNLVGCCPLHPDRSPSFTVYSDDRFHCFGCGAHGDVIDFVMALHGVDHGDALARLDGGQVESSPRSSTPPPRAPDESDRREEAAAIWNGAGPIDGTPAEAYLRRRGITIALPRCLRFARLPWRRVTHPALVAQVVGMDGATIGVHRIFLTEDGAKAKLPDGKVKFSLGPVSSGAIRLAPAQSGMVLCVGVEEGLSLMQILGRPAWAVTGDTALPKLQLPQQITDAIVAHDADPSGLRAAAEAGRASAMRGLSVRMLAPRDGCKDFNQEVMEAQA
jgi:DNA primase